MESASLGACPHCHNPLSPTARFCGACGTPRTPAAGPSAASAPPAGGQIGAQLSTAGGQVGEYVKAAWQVRAARLPLIAAAVMLVGVFLPWLKIADSSVASVSLGQFTGWVTPVVLCALLATAVIAAASLPGRCEWALISASVLSFILAVAAVAVGSLIYLADRAAGVAEDLAQALDDDVATDALSVGIGTYVTVLAAVTVFVGCIRMLRRPGETTEA